MMMRTTEKKSLLIIDLLETYEAHKIMFEQKCGRQDTKKN